MTRRRIRFSGAIAALTIGLLAGGRAAGSGPVVGWPLDVIDYGQAAPPASVRGIDGTAMAIAAGSSHSCAIQAGTGKVVCWGDNDYGQATPPASVNGTAGRATAIAAGSSYTLAIRVPECSDDLDNDGDGLFDFPSDANCDSPVDVSEHEACSDGLDNDGDGSTDFPSDPGCASPIDTSEKSPALACDDGVDNDGDELVDYPADQGCVSPSDDSEVSFVFQVTKTADTDDGVCDADCSLREAVEAANANPGVDLVRLPAGVFPLTMGGLLLSDGVTLQGAGAEHTAIEPSGFGVAGFASESGMTFALENLSIRNGSGLFWAAFSFMGFDAAVNLRLESVSIGDNAGPGLALAGETGSVVIRNSSIVRNRGNGIGGACFFSCSHWAGSFTLENSTVSNNGGVGIELGTPSFEDAPVRIVSSTVARNGGHALYSVIYSCGRGGCFPEPGNRRYDLDHVILGGNNGDGVQCASAAIVSLGHNIASDASCNLTQPSDRPVTDPLLGPLALAPNGTWTLPPMAGSPAIDGGDPAGCRDASGALLGGDQRGVPRPLDGNGGGLAICDVGAHELTACENGLDDDGDGRTDHPSDPGCINALGPRENPQCQDGIDNDGQTGIDFDGGASVNGGVPLSVPDPQCTAAWQNAEAALSCGLGYELAPVLPALLWLRRRRSRAATA